jgi:excinuclease ABC subunit C
MGNKNEILTDLNAAINSLPEKPGVYQYFNAKNEIIYVGKAKNLKKRVSSYFNKVHDYQKINVLVRQIHHLKYIVVDSESDALLLENNLIKELQPRYNAMLKDDKTYPSICIKNEPFPRVFKTRSIEKDGSLYFGPYSSGYTLNIILGLIKELFRLRTCRLPLTNENIEKKKFNVCLEYHLKNCNGPCEGLESEEDYNKTIGQITEILKGNIGNISNMLLTQMKKAANEYKFEEAYELKQKYDLLENYKSTSIITNTKMDDTDVFAYDEDENSAYINVLRISNGCIVQGYTIEYKKKLDEEKEELLSLAIVELRERLHSQSKEIIVPFALKMQLNGINITIPQKGDKKKLLDLSMQNVVQYKLDKLKYTEKLNPEQRSTRILKAIQKELQLDKLPVHIECFDNSNTQGSNPVAACVVFRKTKPSKKEYRLFNIKTVEGPDDYASMKEVVFRMYSRMIEENSPLPNLIITDGGQGQMEVVRKVIEDELGLAIPIAGLVKDKKHRTRELLFGFPTKVIGLKPNDELFKLLASIQDEAHRFAISFHRKKRSKAQTKSSLDEIHGIGEKTKEQLLRKFKSVKRISEVSLEELAKEIGAAKGKVIFNYYRK